MLSVNDIYKSREELLKAFSEFMSGERHKFYLREKKRTVSLVCRARKDCYCDAQIVAHFKKREGVFQIKKVKIAHKCPLGYHFCPNFLEEEIKKRNPQYLGNVIKQLNDSGIRIGYLTAWKVLNKDIAKDETEAENADIEKQHSPIENKENVDENTKINTLKENAMVKDDDTVKPSSFFADNQQNNCDTAEEVRDDEDDNVRKAAIYSGNAFYLDEESECSEESEAVLSEALRTFRAEFMQFNPSCRCEVGGSMIYISFSFLQYLRNVLELKVYLRKKGCVVYGIGYDPLDKPIIVSFVVSEGDVESSLAFFFEHEPKCYNGNFREVDAMCFLKKTAKRRKLVEEKDMHREISMNYIDSASECNETIPITYLTEYDEKLIEVLNNLNVNYFVKTRSICKRYDMSEVERVFNVINFSSEDRLDVNLDPSRYIVGDRHLFGINNFSEVDLDFIFYAVYNFNLFDCLISILKLSADNLNERNYKSFGDNVSLKIERNKKMVEKECSQRVDLENFWCSCGKYQRFLIPCSHACSIILNKGWDPLDFVSRLYDPEIMTHFEKIYPVVDVPVRCQMDRFLLRRGPGRPKKQILVTEKK